jgi:hypothetical protein
VLLLVLIALFGSVGSAPKLFKVLEDSPLIDSAVWLAFFSLVAAVAWQALIKRPTLHQIWIFLSVLGVFTFAWVRFQFPAERSHLFEYSVVALMIYEALLERQNNGRLARNPALLALGLASGLGLLDETTQLFVPERYFDWRDVLFNTGAAVGAITASWSMDWVRQRRAK